jgi:hypothetical protein
LALSFVPLEILILYAIGTCLTKAFAGFTIVLHPPWRNALPERKVPAHEVWVISMIRWEVHNSFPFDRIATTDMARFRQYSPHQAFQGMEISFKIPHPRITMDDQLLPGAESQMMRPAIQPVVIISARPAFDNGAGFRENSLSDAALMVFVHSEHRKNSHAVRLELSHTKKVRAGFREIEVSIPLGYTMPVKIR